MLEPRVVCLLRPHSHGRICRVFRATPNGCGLGVGAGSWGWELVGVVSRAGGDASPAGNRGGWLGGKSACERAICSSSSTPPARDTAPPLRYQLRPASSVLLSADKGRVAFTAGMEPNAGAQRFAHVRGGRFEQRRVDRASDSPIAVNPARSRRCPRRSSRRRRWASP